MTSNSLDRPIALITGAAKGIGFEVARQLASKGATVVLTARDLTQGRAAAAALAAEGRNARFLRLDVADQTSVDQAARDVAGQFGRIDILINNAASNFDYYDSALTVDFDAVQTTLETNLFGAWRTVRAFLPILEQSRSPRIVNVSSGAGSFGDDQFGLVANPASLPAYSISKAALNALTVKLAKELSGTSVLINAVCPGLTASHPGMESIPGARPIEEGAAGVVWAATLPDGGPSGGFFRDGRPLAW